MSGVIDIETITTLKTKAASVKCQRGKSHE
jgi:hypothetical protein